MGSSIFDCPCPVRVSVLSGFSGKTCPVSVCCPDSVQIFCPVSVCPDSVCLDSVRCPDSVRNFVKNPVRCLSVRMSLSRFCPVSGFCPDFQRKTLSIVCLSGRTRARQSCPDFRCPCPPTSGQCTIVSWYEFITASIIDLEWM